MILSNTFQMPYDMISYLFRLRTQIYIIYHISFLKLRIYCSITACSLETLKDFSSKEKLIVTKLIYKIVVRPT